MKEMRKGFTMVELLVVITIIGVLVGLGTYSFQRSVMNSRDERRRVDLESLRSALELWRSNNINGAYPTNLNALVPNFIAAPLTDPQNGAVYLYTPLPAGCNNTAPNYCTSYQIQTRFETGVLYRVNPHGPF